MFSIIEMSVWLTFSETYQRVVILLCIQDKQHIVYDNIGYYLLLALIFRVLDTVGTQYIQISMFNTSSR
jgi:hypothetical protein